MSEEPNLTVRLPQGIIIGRTLTNDLSRPVEAFPGIPYAQPPIGDLQFRPAEKVQTNPSINIVGPQYGPAAPGKPLTT